MKKISGWGIFGICVLAIVLILGFWGVGSYNNLVSLKENVDSKYSDIDVQLQRRSNLIPNIVNTVKGYTSHESKILDEIAKHISQTIEFKIEKKNKACGCGSGNCSR